jgi:Patatin-like phospholipase
MKAPDQSRSAPAPPEQGEGPVGFGDVLAAELAIVEARRRGQGRAVLPGAQPIDLVGLSLSGGGIRSASLCLGAIQGLRSADRLHNFDYLSTVSGGGYTGACLNASMSAAGGGQYPFGDDVRDSAVVAHIRNFSNYLLPRNRSGTRNWLEALAVIVRGLLANAVCVLAFLLPVVLMIVIAYPESKALTDPNLLPRFLAGAARVVEGAWTVPPRAVVRIAVPMLVPLLVWGLLVLVLLAWAMLRSLSSLDRATNDTRSILLRISYGLLLAAVVLTIIDLQPLLMAGLFGFGSLLHRDPDTLSKLFSGLAAAVTFVATFAGRLARFVETSGRSQRRGTSLLRILSRGLLYLGALLLPALIWLTGAVLYLWILAGAPFSVGFHGPLVPETRFGMIVWAWLLAALITACLRANNYSLHGLYRDRLSAAFLVSPAGTDAATGTGGPRSIDAGILSLDRLKLSQLQDSAGPYPIVNCALNLQGSLEANKRGRNADFFIFTPDHVGSALTGYVRTETIESLDNRIDVGAAMAISGAAASANMGGSTVRILSPTLSLMNVRLGYYLFNPRYVGEAKTLGRLAAGAAQRMRDQFFILIEMINGLNEHRRSIFLSDGGHIENLGVYELLRRKCRLILAIDAEADPELGFGSLLKLERYARIDLGTRIALPWEAIAARSRQVSAEIAGGRVSCEHGPHCALGRIIYPDASPGLLVYVKSSLSGDERDYILDYARRNPAFPHESTSDQFFSEEQLEMYRALGFHMIQGLFSRDRISFIEGADGFANETAARAAVDALLPRQGPGSKRQSGSPRPAAPPRARPPKSASAQSTGEA